MTTELINDYISEKTLLGSIGKNHRYIQTLLKEKANIIKKVQLVMDEKARTKTPLNDKQQRMFQNFTGAYAKEGGKLKESLMRMEHIQNDLHSNKTQPFILALVLLQKHQINAINSLRRMIASGKKALSIL